MTTLSVTLDYYQRPTDKASVQEVEGSVLLDVTDLNAGDDLVNLTPDEARSLAALLIAQAEAVER